MDGLRGQLETQSLSACAAESARSLGNPIVVSRTVNYRRAFRRHAALLVGAVEALCAFETLSCGSIRR